MTSLFGEPRRITRGAKGECSAYPDDSFHCRKSPKKPLKNCGQVGRNKPHQDALGAVGVEPKSVARDGHPGMAFLKNRPDNSL